MPSDSGDRQLTSKPQHSGNHPSSDQDSIPCPRCDSTNTKFCYYNNYNLSQPRHFCKGCRRYWTQGGTLRNIPVGGGTRKNAKRSRTSPTTTTTSSYSSVSYPHHQNQETTHPDYHNNNSSNTGKPFSYCASDCVPVKSDTPLVQLRCDFNLNNVNINVSVGDDCDCGGGGFTSLLNTTTTQTTQESNGVGGGGGGGGGPSPPQQQQPPPPQTGSGFLALGGFGLGPGSGFEDIGFDYGSKGFWAPLEGIATEAGGGGGGGGGATWLIGSGGGGNVGGGGAGGDVVDGGYVDGGDHPYFAWPDLAISTTRKGLK